MAIVESSWQPEDCPGLKKKKLVCPKCGGSNYKKTYVGYLGRDENKVHCACGWKGRGYQLREAEIVEQKQG